MKAAHLIAALAAFGLAACGEKPAPSPAPMPKTEAAPAAAAPMPPAAPPAPPASANQDAAPKEEPKK